MKEVLVPDSEFWTSTTTLTKINEKKYFEDKGFPEILKTFMGNCKYSIII